MKKIILKSVSVLFILAGICFADDKVKTGDSTRTFTVSGVTSIETGQIVNGHFRCERLPYRSWLHSMIMRAMVGASLGNRLEIKLEPEFTLWYNTYPITKVTDHVAFDPFKQFYKIDFRHAEGIFYFFGKDRPLLQFAAGVTPFKYNPDVRNLGEYLFRTGCYPSYIIGGFDQSFAKLTGIRLNSIIGGFLRQDILLTMETDIQPLHDISLSYLINGTIAQAVDIGAGINLYRAFPVVKELTTPKNSDNLYLTKTGDSAYYTFQGVKCMARLSIDPKRFFNASVFGKNDLKLYAEAAILGLKNHEAFHFDTVSKTWESDTGNNYYSDLTQRIPIMFGINIPTFKLLDVLALEFEMFKWPYRNIYMTRLFKYEIPIPAPPKGDYDYSDYKKDSWKWSLFAKREVIKGWSIVGQVARDHLRHKISDKAFLDEEEALTRYDEWYWMVKFEYGF